MTPRTAVQESAAQELALLRAEYAELWAYARATVAAARDGELSPYTLLIGWLEERGGLPAPDEHPSQLLAQAYRGVEL